MPFFQRNTQPKEQSLNQEEYRDYFAGGLNFNSYSTYTNNRGIKLSTVYCAVDVISNAVADLPINIYLSDTQGFKTINYNHPVARLINTQPSENLTRYNFFKLIVSAVILQGNAFALINRNANGVITSIQYIPSEWCVINYNQSIDKVQYIVMGKIVDKKDILHFLMHSTDTVHGISVLSYAYDTLKLATDAEQHAKNFFEGGASLSGIIKVDAEVKSTQKKQIIDDWNAVYSGNGQKGIAVLGHNANYQPISINSKDAQLLESRQFSVQEICRYMNISPLKVYQLEHSSYSSLEQTSLAFLQDTVNPYLVMIEQEFNRKIFTPTEQINTSVQFKRSEMLSTDKQATATYYKEMLASGIMTINEVRREMNLMDVDNGNDLWMQLNMSTVNNLINQTPTPAQDSIKQKTGKEIIK